MKYKGKEIGNPSIRQIKNCLKYLGKPKNKFSPEKIYKELEKRHWRSTSGHPICNLENYIHGICSSNSKQLSGKTQNGEKRLFRRLLIKMDIATRRRTQNQ